MKTQSKVRRARGILLSLLLGCVFLGIFALAWHGESEQKVYKLIFIPKTTDSTNGFWLSLIDGAELGAEELGAELEVYGTDTEAEVEEQIELIRSCIEKKPDAMLVAAGDYSRTTAVLREVKDSGIKLILLDSLVDQHIADAEVCTDNYGAGVELGEYAKNLIDEDSVIGIVGHVKGTSTAADREKGIRDGLGAYEEQVADIVFCDSSYDRAYTLTQEMLTKYPDMDVLIGTNQYAAVGAARAVKDMGMEEQIQMVGFDNSIEEIQYLEEGIFQAIIIQKPFNMGYLGVEQAINVLNNREVEYNLNSGSMLITADNLYEEESQRLLYPFSGQ